MPSVGALTLSIKAETESLRADLDKATAKIKQFENQTKQSASSVQTAFGKIDAGRMTAGKAAAGIALVSSTFKQFSGQSDSTASRVMDGLAKMAAGFAVGGPLGAGIVAVTELVGLFGREHSEAMEKAMAEAQQYADKMKKLNEAFTEKLKSDVAGIQKQVKTLTDEGLSGAAKAMRDLVEAQTRLAGTGSLTDKNGLRLRDATSARQIVGQSQTDTANLRAFFDQLGPLRELIPLLEGKARSAAVAQVLADLKAEAGVLGQIAAMESELAGERSDVAEITRKIVEMERERAILGRDTTAQGEKQASDLDKQIALQRQLLTATKSFNAEKANRAILDQIRSLTGDGTDYKKQIEEWTRDGASSGMIEAFREAAASAPMRRFVSSLSSDLQSGISDAVADGILTGGKNGADILNNLLSSVLRKTIDSIVGDIFKGASGLIGGLLGGGGGLASVATSLVGGIDGGGGGSAGAILPLPDT